jgi:hypothetical protein
MGPIHMGSIILQQECVCELVCNYFLLSLIKWCAALLRIRDKKKIGASKVAFCIYRGVNVGTLHYILN